MNALRPAERTSAAAQPVFIRQISDEILENRMKLAVAKLSVVVLLMRNAQPER
jgi:hypothetical protein